MDYKVRLEIFEGPFDLLFHLIEKDEIDIYDIPISRITEQFLDYITIMDFLDIDMASDFLVMAATLLQIKARVLVPKPPPDPDGDEADIVDPREELVNRLLEYRKFKNASEYLGEREDFWRRAYARCIDDLAAIDLKNNQSGSLEGITLSDLVNAFRDVLDSIIVEEPRQIMREEITVQHRMHEIRQNLRIQGQMSFNSLLAEKRTKVYVIVTFLAVLEMIRLKQIRVFQRFQFGDITISAGENLESDEIEPETSEIDN